MQQYKNNIKYIQKSTKYKSENGTEEELIETEIYKKHYGGDHFWKVFLADFLYAMGLLSNSRQIDVILHVMKNVNASENIFIGTYKDIEKATKVSYQTVAHAMQKMQEVDLITRVQNGVYKLSPKIMMKGNQNKKHRLTIEYEKAKEGVNNNNDK